MLRKASKVISLLLAVAMTCSVMAACGNTDSSSETTTAQTSAAAESSSAPEKVTPPEEYTLKFFAPGDTPNQMADILAEAEKQMKDTLNLKLEFTFVPWGDYGNRLSMMLAAGDDFDLHLNAPWLSINDYAKKGLIQPWDDLLAKSGPNVLKATPSLMLEANKFYGKMYGIPNGTTLSGYSGWFIRQDLREKYGMEKPKNLEDIEKFLLKVKENEKGIIPFSVNAASGYDLNPFWTLDLSFKQFNVDKASVNIYTTKDTIEPVKGILDDPHMLQIIDTMYRWNKSGILDKDVVTQKDDKGAFNAGKIACKIGDVFTMDQVQTALGSSVPGAIVEFIPCPGDKLISDFKMWNFTCLNANSKNPERVTQFMDWIYADQAHYDLLQYGIKDKNWVDTGAGTYSIPEGVDGKTNYNLNGAFLLWKPAFDRTLNGAPEDMKAALAKVRDQNSFIKSPLSGFEPVTDNLKNEFAKCNAVWLSVVTPYLCGIKDPATIPEAKKKLETAGYNKIVEEAQKQVNDFLAAK